MSRINHLAANRICSTRRSAVRRQLNFSQMTTYSHPTPVFQANRVIDRAQWAGSVFSNYAREDVLRITKAAADLGEATARKYADWAVAETGFGNADHKEIKNRMCSEGIFKYYKDQNFTSHRVDHQRQVVEIPRPAGVVFALTPSTNPVCSVFFKVLLALMTRNSIVISPHPAAKECCTDATLKLAEAVEKAGAPDGVVQVIENPTLEVIHAVMSSERVDVILATGGSPMVRAAYSSGNPALGVGPGNCPAFVDESADIEHAAKCISDSKAFDNSVLCTNESAVIAHKSISDALIVALQKNGCYLCSDEERDRLADVLFPEGAFDTVVIGKSAEWIAERARIRVPAKTRVLITPLERIGDDYVLSREKLCPVLGFYTVSNRDAAFKACSAMVRRMGSGHSAAIHCKDQKVILEFGAHLNVLRTPVNAPCSTGASGFDTNLAPTMTVGTGFFGRSSVGENVGPQHLVQWSKVAYSKDETVDMREFDNLVLPTVRPYSRGDGPIDYSFSSGFESNGSSGQSSSESVDGAVGRDLRDEIHRIILEEIRSLQLVSESRH